MKLQARVAVVTGGARGIGRAIGLALAEKGCHVVVADLEEAACAAAAEEIARGGVETVGIGCDVALRSAVEALAASAWERFGRVDLLFNNAAIGAGGPLLDASEDDLRRLFDVNLFGVWHGCAVFGRRFVEQGTPAWICNTGSEHSLGYAHPQQGFYTASKHAVLGLSDVLRHELPGHVGVSVLCPGLTATAFGEPPPGAPEPAGDEAPGAELRRAILGRGMDPLEVGRRCVAGVEAGEFIIPTHSHAVAYAERRWQEIRDAFGRQAPRAEGDERYDVSSVVREVLGAGRGA